MHESDTCCTTICLLFFPSSGDELHFRRSVDSSGTSRFSLDGRKLSFGEYKERLQDIGIWIEEKNFLVFQVRRRARRKGESRE